MAVIFILALFSVVPSLHAHIPGSYYEWAEPNGPENVLSSSPILGRVESLNRLTALRDVMAANNIDAYVIPTGDAHNSQYIAATDARREWISGLSGSSGTAVVTAGEALLWTDGRYFTQFYLQVDTELWELMRQGTNITINQWLTTLEAQSVVGIDPTTYTHTAWNTLEILGTACSSLGRLVTDKQGRNKYYTTITIFPPMDTKYANNYNFGFDKRLWSLLSPLNISVVATEDNLVDEARINIGDPPPDRPNNELFLMTVEFTGKSAGDKIAELSAQIVSRGASALVLTALDDIAYTLNLRGSDIPYNPVFFSYLLIKPGSASDDFEYRIILFWGDGQLSPNVEEHLTSQGVQHAEGRPYNQVFEHLRNFTSELPDGSAIWLSQDGSRAIYLAAQDNGRINTISTVSPVALMKCIKNEVELKGFRSAHVKDGTAVIRFLRWVHEEVASGRNVTEMDVSDKLFQLRSEEAYFMGPSFATIAGAGENGAVIHYKPSREDSDRLLGQDDVLLVDSGGQYIDGTTDITRTRHMSSNPTAAQRLTFTRVLKGQILMGTAVFPRGSTGNVLDTLARKSLWDVGLNYEHGTGHGVGHFLNVHEGPSGIGTGLAASDPGIQPGMIFSNEPGYYEVGEYGIRHEDLVEVIEMNRDANHISADTIVGDFNGVGAVAFYTISLAPHQTAFLNVSLLNDHEIKYLNDYHARVLSTIGPILVDRGLQEDYDWLVEECAPIGNAAAILITVTPLLLLSAFSLWF